MSSQEAGGSGRGEEEEVVAPQRVWILTGGDSSERRESLASGLAAWLRLRTQTEVQPELFLLAPRNAGADLAERRGTLLKRRSDLLAMVGAEEDLPEELQVRGRAQPRMKLSISAGMQLASASGQDALRQEMRQLAVLQTVLKN